MDCAEVVEFAVGVNDPLTVRIPPVALITSETHYYLYNAATASRADFNQSPV